MKRFFERLIKKATNNTESIENNTTHIEKLERDLQLGVSIEKLMEMADSLNRDSDNGEFVVKDYPIPNVTWQHIWSYDETQNALSESQFASIPNEIVLNVFKLLSVSDLCNISLVCRRFKMIADQDEIWKSRCNISTILYSKSSKQMYMDWIYMKCLRNEKLKRMGRWHRNACAICLPPAYPIRPSGKHKFEMIGGFHQHPNSSSKMTIKLSVDIEKTAPELLKLLEKASKFQQQWQQSSILKQMITRYYRFMTLKAFYPSNILLIPTLDIEIVWQTHLLRPEIYQTDCLRLFRRVIDHSLIMSDFEKYLRDQAFHDTCQLYEQRFGEQYCSLPTIEQERSGAAMSVNPVFDTENDKLYPYWDETHFEFSASSPKDYENPFSFTEGDIIMDSRWLGFCKQFMSDALTKAPVPDYYRRHHRLNDIDLGIKSINRLKKSYERFLYMAAKYPLKDGNGFIPPTYAIDIIWHSHMQEPLNYASDCVRLVGYVIQHDPWPMIEDDQMKNAQNQTDQIWKDEFQAELTTDHLFNTIGYQLDDV